MFAVRVLAATCQVQAIVPDVLSSEFVWQKIGVAGFVQPVGEKLEQMAIRALRIIRETFFDIAVIQEGKNERGKRFIIVAGRHRGNYITPCADTCPWRSGDQRQSGGLAEAFLSGYQGIGT